MRAGHLPVRSYLAVPVKTHTGEVLGGLFFGHPRPNVFSERHERLAIGISAWAAVAFESARLYREAGVALDEARNANRLKDEFLAVVAVQVWPPFTVRSQSCRTRPCASGVQAIRSTTVPFGEGVGALRSTIDPSRRPPASRSAVPFPLIHAWNHSFVERS